MPAPSGRRCPPEGTDGTSTAPLTINAAAMIAFACASKGSILGVHELLNERPATEFESSMPRVNQRRLPPVYADRQRSRFHTSPHETHRQYVSRSMVLLVVTI